MPWNTGRRHRHRFEAVALPHLDAAYALARCLTRNDADAADVAQEAFLRAFRYSRDEGKVCVDLDLRGQFFGNFGTFTQVNEGV